MLLNQGKLDLSKMRDIEQWKKCNMELSTPFDEVAKMLDAILFQTYGFFDAPEVGGLQGSLLKIKSLDPECPLLKTFTMDIGMHDFKAELFKLKSDLSEQYNVNNKLDRKWTQFEKIQIQSLIYRLEGYDDLAIDLYGKQLAKNPLDLMSLKLIFPLLILNGDAGDLAPFGGYTAKSLPKDNIFYPFVKSYEAFGLEESGQLDLALSVAKDSLSMCPWDPWAVHTVAHVFDSQRKPNEGLDFMRSTSDNWTPCNLLTCHFNWHIGLFHLINNDIGAALQLYDTEIFPRIKDQFSDFTMGDAVSLLTRIEMEQCTNKELDITSRWSDLLHCIPVSDEYQPSYDFYDAHLALAMMCCQQPDRLDKLLGRIEDWIDNYENRIFEEWETDSISNLYATGIMKSNRFATRSQVAMPFVKALQFFQDRDYQSAVNLLHPIRKKFKNLGGSKAQNDLFHQVLVTALLKAGGEENEAILKLLLFERQEQGVNDSYNDRILQRLIDNH